MLWKWNFSTNESPSFPRTDQSQFSLQPPRTQVSICHQFPFQLWEHGSYNATNPFPVLWLVCESRCLTLIGWWWSALWVYRWAGWFCFRVKIFKFTRAPVHCAQEDTSWCVRAKRGRERERKWTETESEWRLIRINIIIKAFPHEKFGKSMIHIFISVLKEGELRMTFLPFKLIWHLTFLHTHPTRNPTPPQSKHFTNIFCLRNWSPYLLMLTKWFYVLK